MLYMFNNGMRGAVEITVQGEAEWCIYMAHQDHATSTIIARTARTFRALRLNVPRSYMYMYMYLLWLSFRPIKLLIITCHAN